MSDRPHRVVIILGLAALASVSLALATIGLAEWQVRTPGGHLISHVDGLKEGYGDCLRADDAGPEGPHIWVSHFVRWRYYEELVAGESKEEHFLFDEKAERLTTFADEAALRQALDRRDLGPPLSPWLTGADGWREAWFPLVVWGPCREAMAKGTPDPVTLTDESCRDALTPERLEPL